MQTINTNLNKKTCKIGQFLKVIRITPCFQHGVC